MPWIANHKHKIEEKSTKSFRSSSKLVGLGPADRISNTDIQCSAIVMQLMFSQIITIDTLELSLEAEIWGIFYEFNPWFWFSLSNYSAVCNMIPYWTVLWWQTTVLRIQCTKAIKKKLPFCFVSAASKAVDMLLESKWGAAKSKDQALFITRSGCADYLDK